MTPTERIKEFLLNTADFSIDSNEIEFLKHDNFETEQVHYRDESAEKSVGGNEEGWQEEWVAIATDPVSDIIFVDTSAPELPVLLFQQRETYGSIFPIADSLDSFKNIIVLLEKHSIRANSIDHDTDPVTEEGYDLLLSQLEAQHPNSKIWFEKAFDVV